MKRLAVAAALFAAPFLSACTSCGASDGWERVYNPACVGRAAHAPSDPAVPGAI